MRDASELALRLMNNTNELDTFWGVGVSPLNNEIEEYFLRLIPAIDARLEWKVLLARFGRTGPDQRRSQSRESWHKEILDHELIMVTGVTFPSLRNSF